jgi:hypothetical protein
MNNPRTENENCAIQMVSNFHCNSDSTSYCSNTSTPYQGIENISSGLRGGVCDRVSASACRQNWHGRLPLRQLWRLGRDGVPTFSIFDPSTILSVWTLMCEDQGVAMVVTSSRTLGRGVSVPEVVLDCAAAENLGRRTDRSAADRFDTSSVAPDSDGSILFARSLGR